MRQGTDGGCVVIRTVDSYDGKQGVSPGLAMRTVLRAGGFLYVPPGTPHLPVNRTASPMVAVVARTDPAEQESVVVLDLPPRLMSVLADFPVAAHG
jgi:uncharacterized RmlC-like cupin family protein